MLVHLVCTLWTFPFLIAMPKLPPNVHSQPGDNILQKLPGTISGYHLKVHCIIFQVFNIFKIFNLKVLTGIFMKQFVQWLQSLTCLKQYCTRLYIYIHSSFSVTFISFAYGTCIVDVKNVFNLKIEPLLHVYQICLFTLISSSMEVLQMYTPWDFVVTSNILLDNSMK